MHFSLLDWMIVLAYLLVVFYFGLLGQKNVKSSSDFLVAGRSMGPYVGAISLLATEIGIITYMYFAEMGFLFGFSTFIAGLLSAAIYVYLGQSGFVIRKFRELELVTIPEFFEKKYGRDVRVLAGILMAIGGTLNFGVFPIIEATFLNIVTGIPQSYVIWTMVALLVVVLVYTALGGMVSVIVTNYIQYVVLVIGMLLITFFCFYAVGWQPMVDVVRTNMGDKGFNPFLTSELGWKFIFWQTLAWLASLTSWAPVAARTFSSENPKVVKTVFTWTGYLFVGRALLPFVWGIAALAWLNGRQVPSIQGTPMFLRDVLPAGISGLVVAGMLAASMSTYSGYLLAWSSVISQDIIAPLLRRPLSPKAHLTLNRVVVLGLTVFIIVWGLFYVIPGATYFYLQMTAAIFLAGTFWSSVGGLYWKAAHKLGAYCAFILGGSSTLLYFIVPNPQEWTGTIGTLSYTLSCAGMIGGSLLGTYVRSTAKKVAVFAGVAALVGGYFLVRALFQASDPWLFIWTASLIGAAVSFTLLSAYALYAGWEETVRVFKVQHTPPGPGSPEER